MSYGVLGGWFVFINMSGGWFESLLTCRMVS